jgi:7,8-dihydroneopterin aldolase/epimerase/oxygenase
MDRIELRGMSFQGRHGVGESERERAQEFRVDVEVEADLAAAGRSDRLEDTVDYRRIRGAAKEVIEGPPRRLIESLAAEIARRVLELPSVAAVSVRVTKRPPSMEPIDAASVHIKRSRA